MSSFGVRPDDASFQYRIDRWVTDGLRSGHKTFGALVAALPGVDPELVRASLGRIARVDGPESGPARAALDDCASAPPAQSRTIDRPIPHPLDYFWGYGRASIGLFVELLRDTTSSEDRIVYLGAPNAFEACAEAMLDRHHFLLDRRDLAGSAMVGSNREFRRVDLLIDEIPRLDARAAVVDPPWYPGEMGAFLWAAREATATGALIWMSSPPAGTRPNIRQEVEAVIAGAQPAGLRLAAEMPGVLRYRSPPFEIASHRVARLGGIPLEWRSGDLLRFEVASRDMAGRPTIVAGDPRWACFEVDEIPICVKQADAAEGAIGEDLLETVVEGDVLKNVSRRSPVRVEVGVWTSLNRVWSSSHPPVLAAICEALATGADLTASVGSTVRRRLTAKETEHVRRVADHLREVVRLEREEHGL